MKISTHLLSILLLCLLVGGSAPAQGQEEGDELYFDDAQAEHSARYPVWFRLSFLNLREDLQEALSYDKRGLIVYFGQEHCPYCKALLEGNFAKRDIERYTRSYFDVVAIDIHGQKTVTDLEGEQLSEKAYARREGVNFTPTLIFYDREGEEALRLQGYYPPYKFRAALEYVADAHYREESFRDYLQRASPPMAFELDGLNQESFFQPPPYALDRSRLPAQMPLAVFFEQGDCHACDVLHSAPLQNEAIRERLGRFEVVQLDSAAQTPVITPAGKRTTSADWADELGLFYTPTLVFFAPGGEEIIRVDSVVGFYRLRKVLDYVLSGAYKEGITLPEYRRDSTGAAP
ncbi:MAG: thioredoxin family protein [Pseudomonadota bacterium]